MRWFWLVLVLSGCPAAEVTIDEDAASSTGAGYCDAYARVRCSQEWFCNAQQPNNGILLCELSEPCVDPGTDEKRVACLAESANQACADVAEGPAPSCL